MKIIPSLFKKHSLTKRTISIASALTMLGSYVVLNLAAVRADESSSTSTTSVSQDSPAQESPNFTPSIESTKNIDETGKDRYIDTRSYGDDSKFGSKETLFRARSQCQTTFKLGHIVDSQCNLAHNQSPTIPSSLSQINNEHSVYLSHDPERFTKRLAPPPLALSSFGGRVGLPIYNVAPLNKVFPQLALAPVPLEGLGSMLNGGLSQLDKRTSIIFPLSIPGAISSAFGWRIHPISGDYKLHTGTDIAAPEGTPVLAVYPGQVESTGWVQGYGLMVSLLHENQTQESRYAHLSQIYVQPGQWVKQGTIIGRVGSTGFTTGPHLHFEWRHLTASGYIPVDAGTHLEYALNNLILSMQRAQANNVPVNQG